MVKNLTLQKKDSCYGKKPLIFMENPIILWKKISFYGKKPSFYEKKTISFYGGKNKKTFYGKTPSFYGKNKHSKRSILWQNNRFKVKN